MDYNNQENRQDKIFDLLKEKGKVTVSELASTLYVSEMTIRRDLADMEKKWFSEALPRRSRTACRPASYFTPHVFGGGRKT